MPASLVFRSKGSLAFVENGWSKKAQLLDVFVDAIAGTSMFDHLPLLAVGDEAAKPRGELGAIKAAFEKGTSPCVLLEGGKTIFSEKTTASFQLSIAPGGAIVMTSVRGATLAELGARALDDFFTIYTLLHDGLRGVAHLVAATAWTNWNENTPTPRLSSDWALQAIGDVLEPGRPREAEVDPVWDATQAIAAAAPPPDAIRTTHGELLMLRWTSDPSDARAADAAAVKHAQWVQKVVKTVPLGGSSTYVPG